MRVGCAVNSVRAVVCDSPRTGYFDPNGAMSERFKVSSVGDGGPQTNYGSMEVEDMDGKVTSPSQSPSGGSGGGGGDGDGDDCGGGGGGGGGDSDPAVTLPFSMPNGN